MKLGILAYSTRTGLGYQTLAYYKWLKPSKTMLVDISDLNFQEQFYGWYRDAHIVKGIPDKNRIQSFLRGLDVVLFAETPLNYEFYFFAKRMNVKTVTAINPEFFDHYNDRYPLPDMFLLPSMWKYDEIKALSDSKGVKCEYLHLPVDRQEFPFTQRKTKKIMHVAGKPAAHDRNGTWEFMQAVPDGTVTTQSQELANHIRKRYRHSNVFTNVASPRDIYHKGDILVLPRRYGGNCLPLNEALSTGMPVIMPDIEPNNYILPKEWLVPAHVTGNFTPRIKVDLYSVDQDALKAKIAEIDSWDIKAESDKADKIAEGISWETLKPKYEQMLEDLVSS
jgi:hypothetical protein